MRMEFADFAVVEFKKNDFAAEERQRELRERYETGHSEGRTFGLMVGLAAVVVVVGVLWCWAAGIQIIG